MSAHDEETGGAERPDPQLGTEPQGADRTTNAGAESAPDITVVTDPTPAQESPSAVRRALVHASALWGATWRGLRAARVRSVALARAGWSHVRATWSSERAHACPAALRALIEQSWTWTRERLPSLRRGGWALARGAALVLLVVGGLRYGGRLFTHPVEPDRVAVRQSKWGGGVAARDFGPGLHLSLPGVHDWYDLPAGTQLLEWHMESGQPTTSNPLEVRTADGNVVTLDVVVPYRVLPGEAHRIVAEGRRVTFTGEVRTLVEQALQDQLGLLSLDAFSNSDARAERVASALEQLGTTLAEAHVAAEDVLIGAIGFSPAYEKKLLETQRERQRGRVLEARRIEDLEKRRILDRQLEIDREVQERRIALDRQVEDVLRAGKTEARALTQALAQAEVRRRAEADRGYDELVAAGQAEVERAGGLERQLRAEILSSDGGVRYLTLAAARATNLREVVLNSNDPRTPNPLDIDAMLELLGEAD